MAEAPENGADEDDHFPSLEELNKLPGLETVWHNLGLQLGVRADDLKKIVNNHPKDRSRCKNEMFAVWRKNNTNPTYEKLIKALIAVGKKDLAESIRRNKVCYSAITSSQKSKVAQSPEIMSGMTSIDNIGMLSLNLYHKVSVADIKRDNHELREENEKLKESISKLEARECDLQVRERELQVREQELRVSKEEHEFQQERRRSEIALTRDEHEIQQERRRSEIALTRDEHEIQQERRRSEIALIYDENKARLERLKIARQENEVRRDSLQIAREEFDFKKQQEGELCKVLLENERLREENQQLKKEFHILTHPGKPIPEQADSRELQTASSDSLKEEKREKDEWYEEFEKINDRETVRCVCPVCNDKLTEHDSKCKKCGLPFDQCGKPLKDHEYSPSMIIHSHAFPKAWLSRACDQHQVIFDARNVSRHSPGTFKVKLLCNTCDGSTASLEKNMLRRVTNYYKPTACATTKIHPKDADLLQIITFRGFLVNINIRHYRCPPDSACSCACNQYFPAIVDFLWNVRKFCQKIQQTTTGVPQMEDVPVPPHEAQMLFYFEEPVNHEDPRLIEFPLICEINIDDDLGSCAMIYAQFPPLGCYWAFPLDPTKTAKLQPHFLKIIERVNCTLSKKWEEYCKSHGKAQEWLQHLKEKKIAPKLVVHYLPECCLKIE